MKALVKRKRECGLWLEDVPEPKIGINDVMIKVDRTGICGTDVHIYKWDAWAKKTIPVPMVVGHEFVGEIVEVGANVTDFRPGDVVSGEGHVVCGRCRNCLAGRRHLCADTKGIGVNRPGAFAEYLALPMTNPADNGKLDTLAEHRVLAQFKGAPYRLCRGRTSLCPEHCGDSGEFATFDIVEYLHYKKPGKYGDEKQKQFALQVSDFRRKPKGDPKTLETVHELKEGDLVLLEWHHLYGEVQPGAFSPVRPVIELRKVTEEEAKLLRAEAAIKLTARDSGKTISVLEGQQITISLTGNPTTGFTWNDATKSNVVKLSGKIEHRVDGPALGAAGESTATFVAVKPGKATIVLEYKRVFEEKPAAKTFTVDVEVQGEAIPPEKP